MENRYVWSSNYSCKPLWIQGSKHQVQAVGEDEVLESLSEHILEIYVENENCLIIWGLVGV